MLSKVPVIMSFSKGVVVMRMASFVLLQAMVVTLVPLVVAGQEFQTPWGDPDLQGIWSNPVVTPLQRSAAYGTREFLTAEEITREEREIFEYSQQLGRDNREGSGTERDVARAYQDHWFGDPSLSRGRRTSMIIDPLDGRIPALTPEAQDSIAEKTEYLQALLQGTSGGRAGPISPRRAEQSPDYNLDRMNRADGPEDRSSGERCFGYNLPVFLQSGTFGGVARIVQSRDAVGINYDLGQGLGFSRSIPITESPHLPSYVHQRYGDARGHWEGDTLVVNITNFSQQTNFQGSRENLHLIERYRRIDTNTLEVRITIEDSTTFTRSFTVIQELTKNSDMENQVYEGACHEGNYGMIGMLVNTRAAEKAFTEGRGPNPETQDSATGGGVISAAPDAVVR